MEDNHNGLQPLENEDVDGKVYDWTAYEEFGIGTSDNERERRVTEVFEINRITRSFTKTILKKKNLEKPDLNTFNYFKKHIKLFREGKFSWEVVFEDLDTLLTTCKTTFSKFSSSLDFEMVDHRLFQKLFPLQLIDQYLSIVNRQYGKPVYDKALRFQTNLLETFLWHHFEADTCFLPKIASEDISLIDPFLRIKIRERNRNDKLIKEKYFGKDFDTKSFTFKILDLYFPNVTWRYIGASQEMHRWSLLLMLRQFELGLFKAEEIHDLLNLLLQKLENLLVLERRSYQDFTTTLVNYPRFIETLKAYFYECKEIVAAICIQIIVLLNDQDFEASCVKGSARTSWQNAYFTDSSISNYINRIMATYLLQFNNTVENSQRESLFQSLNELIKLSTANKEDLYTQAADVVDASRLEFYRHEFSQEDHAQVIELKAGILKLLQTVAFDYDRYKQEELESIIVKDLKTFLVGVAQKRAADGNDYFLNLLGFECLPNMVLSLHNAILELKLSKEVETMIGLTLIVLCKDSKLNQACMLNRLAMKHWDLMFSGNPMIAVVLQGSIFGQDYQIYFNHKSAVPRIFDHFAKALDRCIKLGEVDKKTCSEWLRKIEVDIINSETGSNELDNLVIYFSYCRFICNMISEKNSVYEDRFYNLEIQRILAQDFFIYFLPIIRDPTYLPKAGTAYTFKPTLELSSTPELLSLVQKCAEKCLTVEELKSAVFEVAMLTMKLLNKACTGLYLNSMYRHHAKGACEGLATATEYLLDLQETGFLYRGYVLEFITNFEVFPNDSVISFRSGEFQEEGQGNKECRVLPTHRNGSVPEGILRELTHVPSILNNLNTVPDGPVRKRIHQYYFGALLPYLFKYTNGLYTTYIHTTDADMLTRNVMEIQQAFKSVPSIVNGRLEMGNIEDPFCDTADERLSDLEEKLYPSVKIIRDILNTLIKRIKSIYDKNAEDPIATSAYIRISRKYQRNSPIYSTPDCLEPWVDEKLQATFPIELSGELGSFKKVMREYRTKKLEALDKPAESNILIKFLQSEAIYIPNMITFLDRIIERSFSKLHTECAEGSKEAFENMDLIVSAYLEKDILFTVTNFFSQVLRSCQSVREGFSISLSSNQTVAGFTLTIIYLQMAMLTQLVCCKTFKDSEFSIAKERSKVLSDFLKHLCFDNCQKNKQLMGEFAPSVPGLPYVNKSKKPLFYEIYVRTETQLGGFNIWSNSSNHLVVSDRPEYLEQLMNFLQVITECCSGPCNTNQKQIYIYRSDMYIGMIRRVIHYVDSSFYPVKNQIIDYIGSLIEGDDKLIVNHFASNLTFDELFHLICSTVKRLFLYFRVKRDPSFHKRLIEQVKAAREQHFRQTQTDDEQLRGARENDLEFYLDAVRSSDDGQSSSLSIGKKKSSDKYEGKIYDDPRVITDEMMDLFKVENFEDIVRLYNEDPDFSSNVLLVIALKLNEFLNKFINYVPGYRFSLEKIYNKMSYRFKDNVPKYILERITTQSAHENDDNDERITLYMFISKITDEVTFKTPKQPKAVKVLYPIVPEFYRSIIKQQPENLNRGSPDEEIEIVDLCEGIKQQNVSFDMYSRLAEFLKAKNPRDRNIFEEYIVKHHDSSKSHWLIEVKAGDSSMSKKLAPFQKGANDKIEALSAKIASLESKVDTIMAKLNKL